MLLQLLPRRLKKRSRQAKRTWKDVINKRNKRKKRIERGKKMRRVERMKQLPRRTLKIKRKVNPKKLNKKD